MRARLSVLAGGTEIDHSSLEYVTVVTSRKRKEKQQQQKKPKTKTENKKPFELL